MSTEADWLAGSEQSLAIHRGGRARVNGTGDRNLKLECPACGFTARASAGAVRAAGGLPTCACGSPLELPVLRDRFRLDPDGLQDELERAGFSAARDRGASMSDAEEAARVAWNDAARELERRDLVVPPPARDQRAATSRCQWEGGYCSVFVGGRYCAEHDPHEPARREGSRGV